MRRLAALLLALLLGFPAFAQTPGSVNLVGPSTVPGSPTITPLAINNAINPALALKADAANPVITGITTLTGGTQTVTVDVTPSLDASRGLAGTAINTPGLVYSAFKLVVSPDSLAVPGTNQFVDGLQLQHNYGATAAMTGNRQAMQLNLVQ